MAYWSNLNKVNKKSSFTLLESLVAIYILVSGVFGMLTLASNSIALSSIFRDQLRAVNLAQEGIELVRNKRDSNVQLGDQQCNPPIGSETDPDCANIAVNGIDPSARGLTENEGGGGNGPCKLTGASNKGCQVWWENITAGANGIKNPKLEFDSCHPVNGCDKLNYDGTTGLYMYVLGSPSLFTRTIFVEERARGGGAGFYKELEVISEVKWETRFGAPKEVRVITYLSPWL